VGLIGYTMALFTLLLDIGRPERFWHALLYWNPHSLLWEIAMCVTLYLGVLSMELLPILGEADFMRKRWPRLASFLRSVHRIAPVLAVVGLMLSLLHQSSLGAAFGVVKARPIWFRPGLSLLYILSAMAGGPALTILASMIASRLSPRAIVDEEVLNRLSKVVGWVLVGYFYFRFWDALSMTYTGLPGRNEGFYLLTQGSFALNFWVGEILLGILVPIVILLNNRLRSNQLLRMVALALVAIGLVYYRWDTTVVGQTVLVSYLPQDTLARFTQYTPSLAEIATSLGIVAYGLFAFTLGVQHLRIVDHREAEPVEAEEAPKLQAQPSEAS
jgi:molybdopterin-containing oxidoreductase family membrane subunit